ncbi:c2 domain containing protein [Stylonychia lemnae]|uniref:C2 domain containing protein n=1 Tax=Stylonychia lemnae TaxID=5949 RepID=A0A078A477_STYLE|nr:c2 domain containing protein [Stylonychia lemnae]|eukprot:CDW75559.1 c2 domain containing protein [Stylonychia lemnae]
MGCCMSQTEQRAIQNQNGNHNPGSHSHYPPERANNQASRQAQGGAAHGALSNRDNQNSSSNQVSRISYLQNPNVEKVLTTQTTGEGIKKTPSYETPLTKHELDKWRKEFWETRTQGSSHIWQLLRNACEEVPETAEALIQAAGLTMPQNSLTLALKVRSKKGDVVLGATNLMSILEFKKKFLEKTEDKENPVENIRLFCLGKELKDDLFLYSYDMVDEMVLQAMYKK